MGSALISTTGGHSSLTAASAASAEIQMWEGMAAKGQEAAKAPESMGPQGVRAPFLGSFTFSSVTYKILKLIDFLVVIQLIHRPARTNIR